uniref:Uncharacterized protein n=1 Tax=Stomoxys calcitrans TaxID=35570 RepID=A0A1I8NM61_STOCA
MLKTYLAIFLFVGLLASLGYCETTTTTTQSSNAVEEEESARFPDGYIVSKNLPELEPGCSLSFKCKRKLQNAEQPKPCVQTCVDSLVCNHQKRPIQKYFYCVNFNEELVAQEHDIAISKQKKGGKVAMIDFPCQPGYLPDSRGRCREVW